MDTELKYKEVVRQATIMLCYANGETIHYTSIYDADKGEYNISGLMGNSGNCNIKENGAGLMWDWSRFEYSVAGDKKNE